MKNQMDYSPNVQFRVLGTICFITLLICQIHLKITKEPNQNMVHSVAQSKDFWFLFTLGQPDGTCYVFRASMIISSPVVALVSTLLVLLGKAESNPYFLIPWLFLTFKSLLLVQADNLITIFRDMITSSYHTSGFGLENVKWLAFYFTFFLIDLVEVFSFCEILDLFLVLWNHHPGYNEESANLEAVKREINDIVENLSKCSSVRLSKFSSESTVAGEDREIPISKISSKFQNNEFDERHSGDLLWSSDAKNEMDDSVYKSNSI